MPTTRILFYSVGFGPEKPLSALGRVSSVLGSETELVVRGIQDSPIESIEQDYEVDIVAPLHIREAVRAEREGFDAVAIGCFAEPGIQGAKEAVDIPVVGQVQATTAIAAQLGRAFSIVISSRVPGGSTQTSRSRLKLRSQVQTSFHTQHRSASNLLQRRPSFSGGSSDNTEPNVAGV
jgi:Asp/Glu/hydantoin racemase